MKQSWWKILCVILLSYTIVQGFLGEVPALNILNETIRNLYFHVAILLAMTVLLLTSFIISIIGLAKAGSREGTVLNEQMNERIRNLDIMASEFAMVGLIFGLLGVATGSVWANYTWGAFWTNDPKLNGTALSLLIYLAYAILRRALEDDHQRARVSSVYNIFAFVLLIVFIFVYPRMKESLHPGNGGNPAFSNYDLDSSLRAVFYPAVIGWTLLGVWITQIRVRIKKTELTLLDRELNHETHS